MKDGFDLVDTGDPFDTITPVIPVSDQPRSQSVVAGTLSDPYRRQAVSDARSLWRKSIPGSRGVVAAYLASQGIQLDEIPANLRFLLDHPYMKKTGGLYHELHRGPCILAGIFSEAGQLLGVNQIWVDPTPPHGRAEVQMDGARMSAEVVRGSCKGGFLPLIWPEGATALVLARSLEAALRAYASRPAGLENAAYWAGVDLKVMAGKMQRQKGVRYTGLPDLSDNAAFVAPHWVKRLVFLQEDDSAGVRQKLECGLKRSMHFRPGLRASIVRIGSAAQGRG